jgi:Uma2 family endonuclease
MASVIEGPQVVAERFGGDDEPLFEIIDGQRVELPPMSVLASFVASLLVGELNAFAKSKALGRAVMEILFKLPSLNGNRRPDVGFVSFGRWPKDRSMPAEGNAWDVVPNLAVEVVSPSDFAEELLEKVTEYFQAGVELVWVIYPRLRVVHVYESASRIRVLTESDELDGGSVLSGLRLPLSSLFGQKGS